MGCTDEQAQAKGFQAVIANRTWYVLVYHFQRYWGIPLGIKRYVWYLFYGGSAPVMLHPLLGTDYLELDY